MAERANIAANYRWRMLFVAVFCLLFARWFIYDGAIGYPAQAVRAEKFQEFKSSGRAGWENEWANHAMEQGWPIKNPGKPKGKNDFIAQFMMAGVVAVVSIPFLFIFVSTRGRWIEMDDDGFSTSWGQRCEFDDMYEFDKRKWYNKGIAVIRYESEGKKKRLVLDDCKYDREPTEAFVREVTLDLDEDQVIGQRPEEPLDEQQEGEGDQQGDDSSPESREPAAEREEV